MILKHPRQTGRAIGASGAVGDPFRPGYACAVGAAVDRAAVLDFVGHRVRREARWRCRTSGWQGEVLWKGMLPLRRAVPCSRPAPRLPPLPGGVAASGRAQQDPHRSHQHRACGRGAEKGSPEPAVVPFRVRVGPARGRGAPAGATVQRSLDRSGQGWRAGNRRARGPQVGQEDCPRWQAVAGKHRQDRQWNGEREHPACRRGSVLPSGGRALHASAPLRGRQERSEVAHQAEDSAPAGGTFG